MIPLIIKVKKASHKEIAQGQDILIKEVYEEFPTAVLHGGTAIWRCYNGLRFSEDIDLYLPRTERKIEALFTAVEKKGFRILKKLIENFKEPVDQKELRIFILGGVTPSSQDMYDYIKRMI